MRKLVTVAGLAVVLLLLAGVSTGGADTEGAVVTLPQPQPSWLTPELFRFATRRLAPASVWRYSIRFPYLTSRFARCGVCCVTTEH